MKKLLFCVCIKNFYKSLCLPVISILCLTFLFSCNLKENVIIKNSKTDLISMNAEETIEAYFYAITQNEEEMLETIYPEGSLIGKTEVKNSSKFNLDFYNLKIQYEPAHSESRKPDEVYYITFEADKDNLLYRQLEDIGLNI